MKRIAYLVVCLLALCFTKAKAQYELQPGVLIPTGDYYPYLLKTGIGAELRFNVIGDIDDQWRFGGVLSYYAFQPTADTFITYAIGGNPLQLLPGYEVIHSYTIFGFGLYGNYKILADNDFSPFVGLDFYFHGITIDHDEYVETVVQSSTTGDTYFNYVLEPRIGLQYQLNKHWLFSGGVGYSLGFGGTYGSQDFVKPYLSVAYYR